MWCTVHSIATNQPKEPTMTYQELIAKLEEVEAKTGLYLSDTCVDRENAADPTSDASLYSAAISAAAGRAEEAGHDINQLIGFQIW